MIQSMRMIGKKKDGAAGETIKIVLSLIFGIAADAAVTAAIGGLMPAGRGWKHLLRLGGTFILGMMAGEKAEEYVGRVFDDTKAALTEAKEEIQAEKQDTKATEG